jgi:hypothetical protein
MLVERNSEFNLGPARVWIIEFRIIESRLHVARGTASGWEEGAVHCAGLKGLVQTAPATNGGAVRTGAVAPQTAQTATFHATEKQAGVVAGGAGAMYPQQSQLGAVKGNEENQADGNGAPGWLLQPVFPTVLNSLSANRITFCTTRSIT